MNPAPIDSSRLMAMLSGAKAVMNKVETGDYETGNVTLDTSVDGTQLVEGAGYSNAPMPVQNQTAAPQIRNGQAVFKNMETSKMPDFIKKAMAENPIPQLSGPNHTFNLDDVSELVQRPQRQPVRQPQQPMRQQVAENYQPNDTFTVSESTLVRIVEDIVEKKLLSFMNESYNKNLTEQAIKKTINTLIKEGKIKTKNSVNS